MKNGKINETIIINRDSLKNYKKLSLGLENCENFEIDIADVLDISCAIYKYGNDRDDKRYGYYHTGDGYIKISGRARDTLSGFFNPEYDDYNEDDYKLCNRMSLCNDMCVFSLLDNNDKWKCIYVPYDALENAVSRSEIDYANCPSFEILEGGDMEIRFGKLSKNPMIPRNNYSDLVEDWDKVLGDFKPKALTVRVKNFTVLYSKNEDSIVFVHCAIANKAKKNVEVNFVFTDCDNIDVDTNRKVKTARVHMSRMCDGNTYFGIEGCLWVSCKSCNVVEYEYFDD